MAAILVLSTNEISLSRLSQNFGSLFEVSNPLLFVSILLFRNSDIFCLWRMNSESLHGKEGGSYGDITNSSQQKGTLSIMGLLSFASSNYSYDLNFQYEPREYKVNGLIVVQRLLHYLMKKLELLPKLVFLLQQPRQSCSLIMKNAKFKGCLLIL